MSFSSPSRSIKSLCCLHLGSSIKQWQVTSPMYGHLWGWPQTTAREGIEVCSRRGERDVRSPHGPSTTTGPLAASLCEELKTRPVQSTGPSVRSGGRSDSDPRSDSPLLADWYASGAAGSGVWARGTIRHRDPSGKKGFPSFCNPIKLTERVDSGPETRSGLAGGPPGAITSARGSAPPLGYSLPRAAATPPRIPRGLSRFEGTTASSLVGILTRTHLTLPPRRNRGLDPRSDRPRTDHRRRR